MTFGSLQSFNTLRMVSRASSCNLVTNAETLSGLLKDMAPLDVVVLGEGSNVVLAPQIAQKVLVMRNRGLRSEACGDAVEVTAAAGENWHGLVRWTLAQGFSGLENLALIPGSVGAAPVQNIGAYGVELSSRFARLRAFDLHTGRFVELDASACQFGYRHSLFKASPRRYVITEVTLLLGTRGELMIDYPDIRQELMRMGISKPDAVTVAEAVIRVRRRKLPDPRQIPNAGSFFKNPVVDETVWLDLQRRFPALRAFPVEGGIKMSAAQLIDLAGWKQRPGRGLAVWRRQPLVIISTGATDGSQVLEYARAIERDIVTRFGVRLDIEPDLIGF